MKVYVDELPKSCGCCPCCNNEYGLCQIDNNIQLDDYKHFCVVAKNRHENCPLQSLADYTKQVRKEVLGKLMNMLGDRAELIDCGGVAEFMFTTYDLSMCVKEILGEEVKENEDA